LNRETSQKVLQKKGTKPPQKTEIKQEMLDSAPVLSEKEAGEISIKPNYPHRAIENNWQGKSILLVKIVNGKTSQIIVEKTSGYKILDSSAINAVKRLQAPTYITLSEYWIRIPIEFIIS
jgi:TonB family protein